MQCTSCAKTCEKDCHYHVWSSVALIVFEVDYCLRAADRWHESKNPARLRDDAYLRDDLFLCVLASTSSNLFLSPTQTTNPTSFSLGVDDVGKVVRCGLYILCILPSVTPISPPTQCTTRSNCTPKTSSLSRQHPRGQAAAERAKATRALQGIILSPRGLARLHRCCGSQRCERTIRQGLDVSIKVPQTLHTTVYKP